LKINSDHKQQVAYGMPLLVGLVLIGVLVGIRWLVLIHQKDSSPQKIIEYSGISADELEQAIVPALRESNIVCKPDAVAGNGIKNLSAQVPWGTSILATHLLIRGILDSLDAEIMQVESNPQNSHLILSLGSRDSCLIRFQLSGSAKPVQYKGDIALIIDDFGSRWGKRELDFTKLGVELTVSIIPGAGKSRQISAEMSKRGCEVLLHLPLEPYKIKVKDSGYLIRAGMPVAEIETRVYKAIAEVPGLKGVNNHMGSKATSHVETITRVLSILKRENLFFVDSRTIATTKAYKTAQRLKIKSGERDIFLDSDNSTEAILKQIKIMKKKAKSRKGIIAIGHCRQNTLRILQKEIPRMINEGYRFVYVSKLLK